MSISLYTDARAPQDPERLPCQASGAPDFVETLQRDKAAALCETCPVADACRALAGRLNAAYEAGDDPYGARGVWGGWWFHPGREPRPVLGGDAVGPAPAAVAA